ncbi:TRAP transporter substrate-binding protein [Tessaracoccus sp. Z1128]
MKRSKPLSIGAISILVLGLAACGGGSGDVVATSAAPEDGGGKAMRLSLNQTEEHPSTIALESFNERLSEATDGRWSIEVYPNETLGAQQEALQMVSNSSVDMAIVSGTQLENLNEDFLVFNMPLAFDSVEHQMSVIQNEEIVGELFTSLEDEQSITVLGGFTQGARHVYNTEGPIQTPVDLAGKKLRVQESDLHLAMAKALGAEGTPMAYGEVYTGLQSGVLDAAENNEVSYYTVKHFEVAPYFSRTTHLVGLDYLIINTDVLASMSEEDRATFDEEWKATMDEHVEMWSEKTEEAVTQAEAGGAQFNDVDTQAFAAALEGLQGQFLTTDSQKALWDAARGAA